MTELYTTLNVAASVRLAHDNFTHIVLNRGYTLIKAVYFKSEAIIDLPLYQYASWIPATASQVERWRAKGGVLIDQGTHPTEALPCDVAIMVECPYTMERIEKVMKGVSEGGYGVIPAPVSWRTHEECVDLREPPVDLLQAIWRVVGGKEMTVADMSRETELPIPQMQYLKNALKPVERWWIEKRLAPERDELIESYDWLKSEPIEKREVTKAGFRPQVEELARFGYIKLRRLHEFPKQEPDWRKLAKKREAALNDLAAVRRLIESCPDHLEELGPSDESRESGEH